MLPSYRITAAALIALSALLSGCASNKPAAGAATHDASGVQVSKSGTSLFGFLKPYRIDVQQGNFVSKEMVAQLKPGMTRDQVRFVLGTPLLTDVFHANRWDYEFRLAKGNGELMSSRVSVFFKDNLLEHFEGGDDLPTEQEYLSLIAGSKKGAMPELSDTPVVAPNITNK
ncbi:outer membrane protein assembly factor BamE [Herbaspirillum sp. RV1423]|uniref:outer membrane protein assembly factor BamE n=1 Tax=Herbaspirillum sp. RV1423 TaxID=1443993 RepID=UPI0004BA087A|nr:outer membrane protein assembly factor BamE [Herbaspirillum sp. RV1423]